MTDVLVIAEVRRGTLRDVSLEVITAGCELKAATGGRLTVAVVSEDPDAISPALAREGVDEILQIGTEESDFDAMVAEAAAAALVAETDASVLLLPHTVDSMGFAPALASRRGWGLATDVVRIGWEGGGPVAHRPMFAGKLEAELGFPGSGPAVLLLRAGAFPPAEGPAQVPVRTVSADLPSPAVEHLGFVEAEAGDVDITAADFLLAVGRGIEDEESLPQFEQLAERLGATLSVSRPLVDAGWVSSARQVGQSGKTVKPKVYLALGISGAVQHLAGMREAETIIAVNSDPKAPIFQSAHYGAVADLFEVAEELEQEF